MRPLIPYLLLLVLACGSEEPGPAAAGGAGGSSIPEPRVPALRGVVIDEEGEPVSGVVLLARLPYSAGVPGLTGIEATTGPDGKFELRIEERLEPIRDAPVVLTTRKEGYVSGTHRLPTYGPGRSQDLVITLHPAGVLAGMVTTPAAGGRVYVLRPEVAGGERLGDALNTVIGSDGRFDLAGLPEGNFDVGFLVEGCVPALVGPVEIKAGQITTLAPVELEQGREVSGRVLTPDGDPVPGARVRAFRDPRFKSYVIYGRSCVDQAGGAAQTDDTGGFTIRGLAAGKYTLEADALGYHAVDAARADVAAGAVDVELTLAPKAWVQLIVADEKTEAPVTTFEINVSAVGEAGAPVERRRVQSPAGAHRFAARLSRRYRVEVMAEGYYDAAREVGPVEGGQVLPVTILLLPRK